MEPNWALQGWGFGLLEDGKVVTNGLDIYNGTGVASQVITDIGTGVLHLDGICIDAIDEMEGGTILV